MVLRTDAAPFRALVTDLRRAGRARGSRPMNAP